MTSSCRDAAFAALLRPGDLVLTSRKWWAVYPYRTYALSRGIQRASGSPWNHVMIVTEVPASPRHCYAECIGVTEAHYPRVVARSLASAVDYRSNLMVLRHEGMTADKAQKGLAWLREHENDEYDVTLIAKMVSALRERGQRGLVELRHQVGDHFWICSELACGFIQSCDLYAYPGFDLNSRESVVPDPGALARVPHYQRVYPV
ncbi:MAG: hypothetical protein IPH13_20510 [Planctomycetes bacterium]|nr:hypothetical protein [Planctomycetota bacterium]